MSKLLEAQFTFAEMIPRLLDKANQLGFKYKVGDCLRDARCPYGSKSSRHRSALAIDVNLFQVVTITTTNGKEKIKYVYLAETEDHRKLGEWWEAQGGIWGGRFEDGNHYEWPWPNGR